MRPPLTTDEISQRLFEIDEAESYGHAPRVAMLRAKLESDLATYGLAERSGHSRAVLRVIDGGRANHSNDAA